MQYFFKKFLLIYYCKKRDVKKTTLRAILKTIFNFITYRQEFFLEVNFFSKILYFMSLHNINSSSGFQEDFQDPIAVVLLEKFGDIGCWSLPALAGSIAYLKGYSNIPVGITLLGLFQKCIVDALKAFAPRERPRPFLYGKVSKQDHESFPSSHAAGAFLSVGLSYRLHGFNTSTVALVALSSLVGLSRVLSKKHWPSDVLAGAALGFSAGALCGRVFA